MVRIKREIYNQLVDWAKSEKPCEAAGYLFVDNTIFKKIITTDKSVGHFFDHDTENLLRLITKFSYPTAVFHSHPCAAIPSGTDRYYMQTTIPFFGCIWLIMSDRMRLRAWTLIGIDTDSMIFSEKEVEIV